MPFYRVHLWIDGKHFGPVEAESPDAVRALAEARQVADADGPESLEYTIAELDAEGHWWLVERSHPSAFMTQQEGFPRGL